MMDTEWTALWSRVAISDECWLWTGTLNSYGYGILECNKRRWMAHRLAYELLVGPIPDGLHIDHLCRVRGCVKPSHLEPVTVKENVLRGDGVTAQNARKTHCPHGHPLDGVNRSQRYCKTCNRLALRERHRKRMAARKESA